VREEPGLVVTLDPSRLAGCNKVVSTSTLLLNDTFEQVSAAWRGAQAVAGRRVAQGDADAQPLSGPRRPALAQALTFAHIWRADSLITEIASGSPLISASR